MDCADVTLIDVVLFTRKYEKLISDAGKEAAMEILSTQALNRATSDILSSCIAITLKDKNYSFMKILLDHGGKFDISIITEGRDAFIKDVVFRLPEDDELINLYFLFPSGNALGGWDGKFLSSNLNITLKFVLKTLEVVKWDWDRISKNKAITLRELHEYLHHPKCKWNYRTMLLNPNMTLKFIKKELIPIFEKEGNEITFREKMDYSKTFNFTSEDALENMDIVDPQGLLENEKMTSDFFEKHILPILDTRMEEVWAFDIAKAPFLTIPIYEKILRPIIMKERKEWLERSESKLEEEEKEDIPLGKEGRIHSGPERQSNPELVRERDIKQMFGKQTPLQTLVTANKALPLEYISKIGFRELDARITDLASREDFTITQLLGLVEMNKEGREYTIQELVNMRKLMESASLNKSIPFSEIDKNIDIGKWDINDLSTRPDLDPNFVKKHMSGNVNPYVLSDHPRMLEVIRDATFSSKNNWIMWNVKGQEMVDPGRTGARDEKKDINQSVSTNSAVSVGFVMMYFDKMDFGWAGLSDNLFAKDSRVAAMKREMGL